MKVYVVYEYSVIQYENITRIIGTYSSEQKAKEKINALWVSASGFNRAEYTYEEFELDADKENTNEKA